MGRLSIRCGMRSYSRLLAVAGALIRVPHAERIPHPLNRSLTDLQQRLRQLRSPAR